MTVHLFAYCLLLFKNETSITNGRAFCSLAAEDYLEQNQVVVRARLELGNLKSGV